MTSNTYRGLKSAVKVVQLGGPEKTDEPRSEKIRTISMFLSAGHDPTKNGFRALPRSLYNWLEMHSLVR